MFLNEEKVFKIISEELKKSDISGILKKDKDFEKYIKEMVSDVIVKLFKVLWQQSNFYDKNITR